MNVTSSNSTANATLGVNGNNGFLAPDFTEDDAMSTANSGNEEALISRLSLPFSRYAFVSGQNVTL